MHHHVRNATYIIIVGAIPVNYNELPTSNLGIFTGYL